MLRAPYPTSASSSKVARITAPTTAAPRGALRRGLSRPAALFFIAARAMARAYIATYRCETVGNGGTPSRQQPPSSADPPILAERQGFEPWEPLRVHMISNHAPSATRSSLRGVELAMAALPRDSSRDTRASLARLDKVGRILHLARRRAVRVAEGA